MLPDAAGRVLCEAVLVVVQVVIALVLDGNFARRVLEVAERAARLRLPRQDLGREHVHDGLQHNALANLGRADETYAHERPLRPRSPALAMPPHPNSAMAACTRVSWNQLRAMSPNQPVNHEPNRIRRRSASMPGLHSFMASRAYRASGLCSSSSRSVCACTSLRGRAGRCRGAVAVPLPEELVDARQDAHLEVLAVLAPLEVVRQHVCG